jgi:hypothetical protein
MHPVQYVDILEIHLSIHAIRVFTRIYIKYVQIRANTRIESNPPQIREKTPPLPRESEIATTRPTHEMYNHVVYNERANEPHSEARVRTVCDRVDEPALVPRRYACPEIRT